MLRQLQTNSVSTPLPDFLIKGLVFSAEGYLTLEADEGFDRSQGCI